MRTEIAVAAALSLACVLPPWSLGHAQRPATFDEGDLRLEVVDPGPLLSGRPASVELRVAARGSAWPLWVTPTTEGRAVAVVRGRFLRSDARDPEAAILVFNVPLVARSAGVAVLRVQVASYRCARACTLVRAEITHALRVVDQ